jgi:hypothetical protein
MPNLYDPRNLEGLRRDRLSASMAPMGTELFLLGDPAQGFYTTPSPPSLGFWGVTFHSKRINADLENPGNVLTWVANRTASLLGSEKRFVSVGAGSFMGAAAFGDSNVRSRAQKEKIDGWRWLSNRFSPLQDVSDIDAVLSFEDVAFDANEAVSQFQEASPSLVRVLEAHGRDMDMFREATNREAFQYILSRELMHIQSLQQIQQYNSEIGAFKNISSKIISAGWNWMLTDPTFVPAMMTGVGGVQLAANAEKAGIGLLRAGTALSRARQVGNVAAPIKVAAQAVTRAGGAPAAAYGALSARIGTAAASGVELAMYGAAFDATLQAERIDDWNQIFGDTEWQKEFSWAELGLSTVLVGGFGYALGGATKAFSSARTNQTRRALIESMGGDPDGPVARQGFDGPAVEAQAFDDIERIKFQEVAEAVLGKRHTDLGWLLDRKVLEDFGVSLVDITDAIRTFAVALDGDIIDSAPVLRYLKQFLDQARTKKATEGLDPASKALRRQAEWNALQRAQREIPRGARTAARMKQAVDEFIGEELLRLRTRPVDRPVGMPVKVDVKFLQDQVNVLSRLAERRSLSDLEEDQLLWAAQKLGAMTGEEPKLLVQRRFDISEFQPEDEMAQKVMDLVQDRIILRQNKDRLAGAAKEDKAAIRKAIKNTQARIRRRTKTLRDVLKTLEAEPAPTTADIAQVKSRIAAQRPGSRAERQRLFDQQYEAPNANAASTMEDVTLVGRAMRAGGLGSLFARLGLEKTGQFVTQRSAIAGIRQLTELFDHTRLVVETVDAPGAVHIGNLTDVHRQLVRLFNPMHDFMDKLVTEGFFGKRGFLGRRRLAKIEEFQEDAMLHAMGLREASTDEAKALAKMWNKISDDLGKEGVDNGTIRSFEKNFVPVRVQIGRVMRDKEGFKNALTRFFTKRAQTSDDVHMDTLVLMNLAERIDDPGADSTYRLLGELADVNRRPVAALQRGDIPQEVLDRYDDALTKALNDRGMTAIEESMERVVNRLTDERTFVEESGRIVLDDAGAKVSVFERRLDPEMLLDDELKEYFRTDFASIAFDYIRHQGFDIKANSLVQRLTGVHGLNVFEYLDFHGAQLQRLSRNFGEDPKTVRSGIRELEEKYTRMSGRERRLVAEAEKVGEFFTSIFESGTLAFFGSGIGQAVASTEMMFPLITNVIRPTQFARTLGAVLKGINPITHKQTFRDYLAYTALAPRMAQQINAQRFVGGSIQSDFQWGTMDRILAPWRQFLDTVSGRTAPAPRSPLSRGATAVPQFIEALGRTNFIVGGADYFTRIAWIGNMVSLQGETARFLPAARKLATLLQDNAEKLKKANREAREAHAALKNVDVDSKTAIRAGNKAQFQVWKGLTREAGFGPRWQVARRFAESGLLDPRMLDVLIEAGDAIPGSIKRGLVPMMDVQRLAKFSESGLDAQKRADFQEAMNRLMNSFEDTIRRRVSEQQILQTPTNEASRSYWGRMFNSMTSFSRSFFDNNVLDMAAMPSRNAAGMFTAFFLGEALNRMARRMWNGEEVDDILQELEDRPAATMMNYALNLPLLGQNNWLLRMFMEPLLTPTAHNQSFTQGAAVSVANNMLNFTRDAAIAPFDEKARERLSNDSVKFGRRFIPGVMTHYGGVAILGSEAAFDVRLRPENKRRGTSTDPRPKHYDEDALIDGEFGDILPPQDNLNLDDDLSFMLPQETS